MKKRPLITPSVVAAGTHKYDVGFGVAEFGNLSRELMVAAQVGVKKRKLGSTRRGLIDTALKSDVRLNKAEFSIRNIDEDG